MTPTIIVCPNDQTINEYLSKTYPAIDTLTLDDEQKSIGIQDIHQLISQASFKSTKTKNFIIKISKPISNEAQNSLLKTLEESALNNNFVITVPNLNVLLSTIISRCQVLFLENDKLVTNDQFAKVMIKTITAKPSQVISFVDGISKELAIEHLTSFIHTLSGANRKISNSKRIKIIELAIQSLYEINQNINHKLVLDHFLLKSHSLI